jgi:hypothetical protein
MPEGQLRWSSISMSGYRVDTLIESSTRLEWYQLDGLNSIIWEPRRADLVVREDATPEQKLNALAILINERTGQAIRFVKQKKSRLAIVQTKAPTRPGFRRDQHEMVVLTQEPWSDEIAIRWQNMLRPPEGTYRSTSLGSAGKALAAPILQEGAGSTGGKHYIVPPDSHLDPADPDLAAKLQRVVENIHKQVGGEFKVEMKEFEVFVVEHIDK